MKKLTLLACISISLIPLGFAIWLGTVWYGEIEVVQMVTVLYSKKEMFVFVEHGKSVYADRRWHLLATHLVNPFVFPDTISKDMLVVHLKNGILNSNELRAFGFGGSPFVFHQQVYWLRGYIEQDYSGPTHWRWEGTNFIGLSRPEGSKIDAQFEDIDKRTQLEGWAQASFIIGSLNQKQTFHLQNGDISICAVTTVPSNTTQPRTKVILSQPAGLKSDQVLVAVNDGYRTISRTEYIELKKSRSFRDQDKF